PGQLPPPRLPLARKFPLPLPLQASSNLRGIMAATKSVSHRWFGASPVKIKLTLLKYRELAREAASASATSWRPLRVVRRHLPHQLPRLQARHRIQRSKSASRASAFTLATTKCSPCPTC